MSSSESKSRYLTSILSDAWRIYEDVCIVCAGLWIGSWRGNSAASYSTANGPENWGSVRLDGDDDLSLRGVMSVSSSRANPPSSFNPVVSGKGKVSMDSQKTYVRNLGMGIEGRPLDKTTRRTSAMSWSSGRATVVGSSGPGKTRQVSSALEPSLSTSSAGNNGPTAITELEAIGVTDERDGDITQEPQPRNGQANTAMALIQTFHAHTMFQLSVLEALLAERGLLSDRGSDSAQGGAKAITLSPKDILAFELGPMSSFDARYLEWLVKEYASGNAHADDVQVVVKRSWRDMLGVLLGY